MCPDQYVGLIADNKANGALLRRQPASMRSTDRAVLLVLESPHTKEFEGDLGPARGPTGANIARFIEEVPGLADVGRLPLLLVNAVQYQCSLGKKTIRYRDRVFRAVWENGGREDFASRIRAIYRTGDLVVCSCTKGAMTGRDELRRLVYGALCDALPAAIVLRRSHPAKWNIEKNRNLKWD